MKRKRILAAVTAVALAFSATPITVIAAADIPITAAYFPDEDFRDYIKREFDTDTNDSLSAEEIEAATDMNDLYSSWAEDLTGLGYFTYLEKLDCSNLELTKPLDVSKNTKLEELTCTNMGLTSLDLVKNIALVKLNCSNNELTSLDLKANTKLEALDVSHNQLTSIDISKNTLLEKIDCSHNQLKALDLSKIAALNELDLNCDNNPIISLELSGEIWNLQANDLKYSMDETVTSYDEFISKLKEYDPKFNEKNVEWISGIDLEDSVGYPYDHFDQDDRDGYEVSYNYDCGNDDDTIVVTIEIARLRIGKEETGIDINPANFPDYDFRQYILDELDTSEGGKLSDGEIAAADEIDVSDKNIKTLKGIEYFTALTTLDISNNPIISLDLTANTLVNSITDTGIGYTISSEIKTYEGLIAALKAYDNDFDVSKVTWTNGIDNSTHDFDANDGSLEVTYNYDCGNGQTISPTITIEKLGKPAEKPSTPATITINGENTVTLKKLTDERKTVNVTGFAGIDAAAADGGISWSYLAQLTNYAELTVAISSDDQYLKVDLSDLPTSDFAKAGTKTLTISIADGANITERINGTVYIYLKDATGHTFAEGSVTVYIEPNNQGGNTPGTGDGDDDDDNKGGNTPGTGDGDDDDDNKGGNTPGTGGGDDDDDNKGNGGNKPGTGNNPGTGENPGGNNPNVPNNPDTPTPSEPSIEAAPPMIPNNFPDYVVSNPEDEMIEDISSFIEILENGFYGYTDDLDGANHIEVPVRNTRVTKEVIDAIAGHDVTVDFQLSNGAVWEVNGLEVDKAKTINLGVRMNSKRVSKEAIETFADDRKTIQFYLKHKGKLGFNATLNIPVNKKYNGMYANLYYYKDGEFVFVESSKISGNTAKFGLSYAYDDYIIVLDNHAYYTDGSFIV